MLNNTLRLNFCYLKIIHILYPHYHPKITQHTLKNKQKNMYVCIHDIIQVILTKMKKKMENRSNRYDMDANIDLHGYKFSKCKKCLSMMMLIRIKQHLGDIWSWIHEKVNPFHATDLFSYPLKTSENQRFSDVFRGYQKRSVAWNGLSNNEAELKKSVAYEK